MGDCEAEGKAELKDEIRVSMRLGDLIALIESIIAHFKSRFARFHKVASSPNMRPPIPRRLAGHVSLGNPRPEVEKHSSKTWAEREKERVAVTERRAGSGEWKAETSESGTSGHVRAENVCFRKGVVCLHSDLIPQYKRLALISWVSRS